MDHDELLRLAVECDDADDLLACWVMQQHNPVTSSTFDKNWPRFDFENVNESRATAEFRFEKDDILVSTMRLGYLIPYSWITKLQLVALTRSA